MTEKLDQYAAIFGQAVPFLEAALRSMTGGVEAETVVADRVRSWSWKIPSGLTLSLVVTDETDELRLPARAAGASARRPGPDHGGGGLPHQRAEKAPESAPGGHRADQA